MWAFTLGFPCGSDSKASACNVGDLGSTPGSWRSPGEGNGNPLQYSAWKISWSEEPSRLQSMGSQSWTRLSDFMSNSLWLQHARFPCPSPSPGVCSNVCLLSQWCHPTISSSVIPFSSCLHSLQYQVYSSESAVHIRWLMYWSFSFSVLPSNEYSGLTSFRIYWFDHLAVQETLKSLHQHHSSKASVLCHSALTSIHDYWKNHSFDYMDLCWQSNVSAF